MAQQRLTVWVANNTSDLGTAASADLPVGTLHEVESSSPKLPSPAEVADAVVPVILSSKWRVRQGGIAHEAASGVGVQSQEKGNEEVVGVPEGLE